MPKRHNNRARKVALRESAATTTIRPAATLDLRESSGSLQAAGKCKKATAKLISGDTWGTKGYYPGAMLAAHGPAAWPVGTQMYLNHPSLTEEADRPERSLHDLAGKISSTPIYQADGPDGPGLYASVDIYPHVAPIIEAMHGDIGLSIRANGTAEPGTRDGRSGLVVTSISPSPSNSVDYVTRAGCGGKLVALLEASRPPTEPTRTPLRLALQEAGSVGAWFEARIHSEFTEDADSSYGWGELSRSERIALSGAIGDALDAFVARLTADAPQLYARDRWGDAPTCPQEPAMTADPCTTGPADTSMTDMTMTESGKPGTLPRPATAHREEPPMTGSTTGTEPATHAVVDPRIATLEIQLAEAARQNEATQAQLAEAQAQAQELLARDLRTRNETTARQAATRLLGDSAIEARFRPATAPLIEAAALAHVAPLTAEADPTALETAITAAITAESARLAMLAEAFGAGIPTGLGATRTGLGAEGDDTATITALMESYRARGMSESAARAAATGRPY